MVYNFVGTALTLADLEKAAIEETRKPLSDGARELWDYFGFDREDEWKAVLTDSNGVLITEESQDLNMANIYPNIDSFIIWLEESHDERQKAAEKERRFQEQKRQIEQQVEPASRTTSRTTSQTYGGTTASGTSNGITTGVE